MAVKNIYADTLAPLDVTKFTLFRGVTDYTQLQQFDLYETGYSYLITLQFPVFLNALAKASDEKGGYADLINSYRHIIEWEFKGASGIEDITSETSALSNGITDLNVITRVTEQGGSQFTMNYFERSGSVLTKVNELYLRGIKDPRTQIKRYNGLLQGPLTIRGNNTPLIMDGGKVSGMQDKGFQYEIFHFLLIVTDNTGLNVEKAYILASCQPTAANTSIYNVARNEIGFSEIPLTFNGLPIPGRIVNKKAAEFLRYINKHCCFDEMEYGYQILGNTAVDTESGDVNSTEAYVKAVEEANNGGKEIFSSAVKDNGDVISETEAGHPGWLDYELTNTSTQSSSGE